MYSEFSENSGHSVSRPPMEPMVNCVGLFRMRPALPPSPCSKMKMTACGGAHASKGGACQRPGREECRCLGKTAFLHALQLPAQ